MSLLEELRAVEGRIIARLGELRPAVEEYEELQRIASQLGIGADVGRSTPERRPLAPVPKPARSTTAKARRVPATKPRTRVRRSGGVDTAPAGGGTTDRHSGGTRAKGAERRQQVIELIRARPGITVPDVSQELGLEPPPVYRVIRKLQASGIVIKEGRSLRLS